MIRNLMIAAIAALGLCLSAPALAAPPAGDGHGHEDAGHAKTDDGHGDAHGDGDHGDGDHGGDHHYYTDDDDHDGTPNWRDSDSEQFMLPSLGAHAFNLVLYAAILFFFLRRPLGDALRERALGIRKAITDSAKQRDEAKETHDEVTARLQKLEEEITTMRAEAEADAKLEAEKMVERARAEAERIAQTAERNIRDEIARARIELRKDAVELAVQLAENTLRDSVNSDDQQRLAQEFLTTLNDGASADA